MLRSRSLSSSAFGLREVLLDAGKAFSPFVTGHNSGRAPRLVVSATLGAEGGERWCSRRWASGRDRAIEGALAFRAVLGSLGSTGGDPVAVSVSLSPGG